MRLRLAIVLMAVALVTAGCSAGNPPVAGPTPTSPPASTSATPQPDASAEETSSQTSAAPYAAGTVEYEVVVAAKAYLKREAPKVAVASVEDVKVARDSDGSYWASAWAIPASTDVDAQVVFLHKAGSKWKVTDYGSGIDGSELPKDVRSALWSD